MIFQRFTASIVGKKHITPIDHLPRLVPLDTRGMNRGGKQAYAAMRSTAGAVRNAFQPWMRASSMRRFIA
jgi:hypothetical protein